MSGLRVRIRVPAGRVAVMHQGELMQLGAPREVYNAMAWTLPSTTAGNPSSPRSERARAERLMP
jgi:ABC-type sugar transport system ATPase subunit